MNRVRTGRAVPGARVICQPCEGRGTVAIGDDTTCGRCDGVGHSPAGEHEQPTHVRVLTAEAS